MTQLAVYPLETQTTSKPRVVWQLKSQKMLSVMQKDWIGVAKEAKRSREERQT